MLSCTISTRFDRRESAARERHRGGDCKARPTTCIDHTNEWQKRPRNDHRLHAYHADADVGRNVTPARRSAASSERCARCRPRASGCLGPLKDLDRPSLTNEHAAREHAGHRAADDNRLPHRPSLNLLRDAFRCGISTGAKRHVHRPTHERGDPPGTVGGPADRPADRSGARALFPMVSRDNRGPMPTTWSA